MAVYANEQQVYDCFRMLFAQIEHYEPQAAEKLLKSRLAIRFLCSAPMAEITIDARQRPLQIHYGPSNVKPELDITLAADTLHCLLLGELRLSKAMGNRLIKPKGPIFKVLALGDLFCHAQRYYPQVLQTKGLPLNCK